MSNVTNTNVFDAEKKFVDIVGLNYFWGKTKGYVDAADERLSGEIAANTKSIEDINAELNTLSGGVGSVGTQINQAIEALDLPNTYEAKGEAAKAEAAAKAYTDGEIGKLSFDAAGTAKTLADAAEKNAKDYADGKFQVAGNYELAGTAAGLNAAMDARVLVLEGIDHNQLAADAAASAVATVLDGAPESFDTLKEVAEWIGNNEHASDVATLVTDVAALKAIDHEAYVAADNLVLTNAKKYTDDVIADINLPANYEVKGAASQALEDAKTYVGEEIAKLSFDEAGTAEAKANAALAEAKSYADGKDSAMNTRVAALEAIDHSVYAKAANVYTKGEVDSAVEAAKNAAIADASAKLASYYTKTEVDNLLSTNSQADQAYAKTYTDQLFNSFNFAANSDIDGLFA